MLRGPFDCIVQNSCRFDDLAALPLSRVALVSRSLDEQPVDGPLHVLPTLRVRRTAVPAIALHVDRHLELAAAWRLDQHQDELVLLRLGLVVASALVLCSDQLMLEIDQIRLREVAILLVVVEGLKLVKHLFQLSTMLLQLLAADLTHFICVLQVLDFGAQLGYLCILRPVAFFAWLLDLRLLLDFATLPFLNENVRFGSCPRDVVFLISFD